MQLYRKIVLTDNYIGRHHAENNLDNWHSNYGTTVYSLERLADVISQNDKLAELINMVIVSGGYFDNDERLIRILLKTNVRHFYFRGCMKLPNRLLGSARSLLIHLTDSVIAPNLNKLEIHSRSVSGEVETFRKLALSLIENGIYEHLTTLLFKQREDQSINLLNVFNSLQTVHAKPLASWIAFIDVFHQKGYRMNLKHLALQGFLSDTGNLVADLLVECIDMSTLESLEIHCTEASHQHSRHLELNTTILNSLTKHTHGLKRLALNPTFDCLSCQMESIISALTINLKDQLTDLLVVLESPNSSSSDDIKQAILEHQSGLQYLKWTDRGMAPGKTALYRQLSQNQLVSWEHASFYETCIQDTYFPDCSLQDIYQNPITVDAKMWQIQKGLPLIKDFLKKDVIYNSLHCLPKLIKYQIFGLTVVPQSDSLLVNGDEIRLNTEEISTIKPADAEEADSETATD